MLRSAGDLICLACGFNDGDAPASEVLEEAVERQQTGKPPIRHPQHGKLKL